MNERNDRLNILQRGDIVLAYFPEVKTERSSIQTGVRPAVVVQNDMGNKHSPVIQLSPVTSSTKTSLPTHVLIEDTQLGGTGLTKRSTILCEATRPIDRHLIKVRLGRLTSDFMEKVNTALLVEYGLA